MAPTADFDELLAEHAGVLYGMLGGQPLQIWRARRTLRRKGVALRSVNMLYPEVDTYVQVSTRLSAIARSQPELMKVIVAAAHPSASGPIGRSLADGKIDSGDEIWYLPEADSHLRRWVMAQGVDRQLDYAEATRLETMLFRIAWASERPEFFAPADQIQLIEGIEIFLDRLSAHGSVRYSQSYLLATAHSPLTMQQSTAAPERSFLARGMVSFPICTRQDRLAELWVRSVTD